MKSEIKKRRDYFLAAGLMILGTFLWGSAFAVIRLLLKDLQGNPLYLLACRFIPTGIFFLFYLFFSARSLMREALRKDWKLFLGSAFFGIIVYHLSINLAETVVRADEASLVISLLPLLTVIASSVIYKEKQALSLWSGAFVSLIGVYVMIHFTSPGEQISIGNFRLSPLWGHLFIFICPVTMVIYTFISRPLSDRYPPALSIGAGFILATIPMAAFVDSGLIAILINAPASFWAALSFLVLGSTISGYLLWIISLRLTNPSYVNLFIYLNPVWGMITNKLLFPNEKITAGMLIGGILILAGVMIGTGKLQLKRKI